LQDFKIKSVILTRNPYDAVVSFARDLRVKLDLPAANPGQYGYSFVWLTDDMRSWSLEQLMDYSIEYYIPWYMNFLRSWDAYKGILNSYPLRYETLKQSPAPEFSLLYRHFYSALGPDFSEYAGKSFGSKELMSQTSSDTGKGYDQLDSRQIGRIKKQFRSSDSNWISSHLELAQ